MEDPGQEPSQDPNDGSMQVDSIQVGGVIKDDYGNEWAVPNDDTLDYYDLYADDIYTKAIKDSPQLKGFHVQMIREEQIGEYRKRGFVPVREEELPIPVITKREYGQPTSTTHAYSGAVMVKIPQQYRDIWERRKGERARERVASMQPTKEMLAKANKDLPVDLLHKRTFTPAEVKDQKE